MSEINLPAFLTFALITIFTPGPNNISSASSGILFGYRRTLPYILGIITGFLGVMLGSGLLSQTLNKNFPSIESPLRIVGALYILWLAYGSLRTSYNFELQGAPASGYWSGFVLQAVNPKGFIFGLTVYSTFLAPLLDNGGLLLLSGLFLTLLAFAAVSLWALSGAAIRRYLKDTRIQRMVNAILALLLVYTAYEISGLSQLLN